ncbi:tetratricopeptide repeat protein [Hanstruepera marina]|uniref:tetratricopeptide repeat protein n=1 Tax=Hanstruepera marina TaxID=2873265 RepID=UPI001CA782F0|nr:tetratricopeptide repeat protein [Hanstruepera marina]
MKHILLYIVTFCTFNAFSQDHEKEQFKAVEQAKELVYEANQLASSDDYVSAEMEYRKAISKEPNMAVGNYNLANSYYEKGNFDEAFYRLQQAAKVAKTKEEKHKAYHNIGNVLMQNKKCKEAVEAFKNALRNNPSDEETRYNFALAKQCAEEQQDQQDQEDENKDQNDKNNENKDQDENKEDQKENEDENKEDQKDKGDQDKKEGEDEKDDKGDPKDEKDKDGNQENKEQDQKKPQPKPGQLSPQQIKNLLEAMNNQEEKVQEKINAEKTKGAKVRSEKDW